MFRFIHSADIHLDSPMYRLDAYDTAPVDDFRQATRRALERLVNLALHEKVNFVLIVGDLYDGDWKDYNTGLHLAAQLRKLGQAGIQVFIVSGNHDAASKITKTLTFSENVKAFPTDRPKTCTLDDLKVAVHGQGFANPAITDNLIPKYPDPISGYFNIGMLHTAVTGLIGHAPYAPCSLEDLTSKGYEYWALGHVHKRQMLREDPPIIFPGNTQGRHVKETGAKGCLLVEVDDAFRMEIEFYPVDVVRWEVATVDANRLQDREELLNLIKEEFTALFELHDGMPLAVRLVVKGETYLHEELTANPDHWLTEFRSLAGEAGQGKIWLEKVKLHTQPVPAKGALSKRGAIGELSALIDDLAQNKKARTSLVADLLDLKKKLPREILTGDEALTLDEVWLESSLEQIRSLLISSLLAKGDQQ